MLARQPVNPLPPICAWNLFQSGIVDHFKDGALPDILTRDSLKHISPDMQSRIMTSLRALRLIDDRGQVQSDLKKLIASRNTGQWQNDLRVLMQTRYPYVAPAGLSRATSGELHAAFKKYVGRETGNLSKAEAFFLNLARASGVQLSDALKKRVATADSMAAVRAARTPKPKANSKEKNPMNSAKPMSKQERVEKIFDILRMFQGEGLPAEPLAALLTLWDYAKKSAESEQ